MRARAGNVFASVTGDTVVDLAEIVQVAGRTVEVQVAPGRSSQKNQQRRRHSRRVEACATKGIYLVGSGVPTNSPRFNQVSLVYAFARDQPIKA